MPYPHDQLNRSRSRRIIRCAPRLRKVGGSTTLRTCLAYGAIVLTLAACADSSFTPPVVPPSKVGGLTPTTTTPVTAEDVASEAVDAEALSGILDVAGFQAGVRRAYAGDGRAIRRLEVGVFSFESNEGASTYLAWLRANVADLIGEVRGPDKTLFGDVPLVVHLPDGCCPREPAVAFAAWSRGPQVVRVLIAGAAADGRKAVRLIREVRTSTFRYPTT
jgi:hypothetical protein